MFSTYLGSLSLNSEPSQAIQEVLREEFSRKGTTVIIVAHRISCVVYRVPRVRTDILQRTIIDADCVIVMERGQVAESGSPQTLLEADGIFSQLARLEGL